MLGYILLFLFVFLIGYSRCSNKQKLSLAFSVIFLFSGLRYGIGYDYFSYFQIIQDEEFQTEFIPKVMMNIARDTHFSVFFLLSSLWICFFFATGLIKVNCSYECVVFFIGYPSLLMMSLSTIRQSMAFSVIFLLLCNKNPGLLKKLLYISVAFLCHQSSVIALLLLLPLGRLGKRALWICIVLSFILGEVVSKILLSVDAGSLIMLKFQHYLSEDMGGGGFLRLVMYILTFFSLWHYDRLKSRGCGDYVAYVCIGCSLYSLFSVNAHLAERFCTFFFSAIMIYVHDLRVLLRVPKAVYNVAFIVIFIGYVYIAHVTSQAIGQWTRYKNSSYYPYETFIGK